MTRVYTPDRWVVLELNSPEYGKIRKVLAGWYGGFAQGDEWKLNSGITKVTKEDDFWLFTGESGSIYKCHKDAHGMSSYMGSIYSGFVQSIKDTDTTIEVIKYEDSFTV